MNFTSDRRRRQAGATSMSLLLAAVLVCLGPFARSQNAGGSGAATGSHDISGVWDKPGASKNPAFAGGGMKFLTREEPSMTAWGLEKFNFNRQGVKPTDTFGNQNIDPSRYCYPPGPARIMSGPQAFEIRQLPDEVLILFERDHWIRRIYTDGRGHPQGYPITWMGHTTGKWDGDTLVADTVFINPITWLDTIAHPQSEQMHLIERFRRSSPQNLQLDTTFDDPKAYTKPWTEKKTFELMPKGYEIMEHVECEEWLKVGEITKLPPKPL